MSWFYADGTQQIGPVTETDWNTLIGSGKIKPETLVWREGMPTWAPYSTVASTVAEGAPAVVSQVRCSECGNSFPPDQVIRIDNNWVCAGCKPMVVQKMKEGVHIAGEFVYAGFWIRVGAKLVDGIILLVVRMLVGGLVGAVMGAVMGSSQNSLAIIKVVAALAGIALQAAYTIYFVGKFSATPGKMACGLKVIRPDGTPMTYGRACGRFFGEWLSGLTLGIGYLMVAFDDEKRALHDRVCDTRVVKA